MLIVVLGATGEMGVRVADLLEERGHVVRRASRSTGVDVVSGTGLAQALDGAGTVVDCLNIQSQRRSRAVPFFSGAAGRVAEAAAQAGVAHLVVLSIVNASDPAPRRFTGYYAGKAAQEAAYAGSSVPVTLVRTTAWFSLARMFVGIARVGPLRLVPSMRLQPVHPEAVAVLLADVAAGEPPRRRRLVQLAGPDVLTSGAMAGALARADRLPGRVVPVPVPGAMRRALLPRPGTPSDARTFADWIDDPARPRS
jgi:uncharacterized protein YbjT (DUF2867 family)